MVKGSSLFWAALFLCVALHYVCSTRSKYALKRPVDRFGCPLIRAWKTCPKGFYMKQGRDWVRGARISLQRHNFDYACKQNHHEWYDKRMATCVFAENYCPRLRHTGPSNCVSDKSQTTDHDRIHDTNFRSMHATVWDLRDPREDEGATYSLDCYSYSAYAHVELLRPSFHICENDKVPGKGAYGYHYIHGNHIYIVGPESPMSYQEGWFHRMFQITMPADGSDIWVWPYHRSYSRGTIVKVTIHSLSYQPMYSAVNSSQADRSTFRIHLYRESCVRGGAEKVNVIQMMSGDYISQWDYHSRIRVESRTTRSGDDYIPLDWFTHTPIVLVQLMDPQANYDWVTMKSWRSHKWQLANARGFPGNKGLPVTIGFISIGVTGGRTEMFGPYTTVEVDMGDKCNVNASTTRKLNFNGNEFAGEPMVFLQAQHAHEEARLHSATPNSCTFGVKRPCGWTNSQRVAVHRLAISFVNSPDKPSVAVREELEDHLKADYYVNVNCPWLSSQGKCAGLYRSVDYRIWRNIAKPNLMLVIEGIHIVCYNNGALVEFNKATCIFSDSYCAFLTVLTGNLEERYKMAAAKAWGYGGGAQVTYAGRHSSGRMRLHPYGTMVDKEYVCENDVLARGPVYGMNHFKGENIYVVGSKDIIEGLYFRIFRIELPANSGPVTVYPMVFEWGRRATVTKLMVQDQSEGHPVIPTITMGLNSTFKFELWRPSCDSSKTFTGTVRINVLQVRFGFFSDPWNFSEYIGAGTNQIIGGGRGSFTYVFSGPVVKTFNTTPIVFSQIYEMGNVTHRYYHAALSKVTTSGFDLQIKGYQNETVPDVFFNYTWIGIGLTSPFNLFHSAIATKLTASQSTDTLSDASFAEYYSEPYVFVQSHDVQGDINAHDIVRDVKLGKATIGIELESCQAVPAQTGTITGIVIGPVAKKRRRTFNHLVHGCAASVFPNAKKQCPLLDNYCYRALVLAPHVEGVYRNNGFKTLKTHEEIENNGFYFTMVKSLRHDPDQLWGEYYDQTNLKFALRQSEKRNYQPVFEAADPKNNRHLNPHQVICLRHPDMERVGRIVHNGKSMWNASQDVIEAPGTPHAQNIEPNPRPRGLTGYVWTTKGVVYVKYFQMEVQSGDEHGNGLYTYVGGARMGRFHAYGTVFSPSVMGVVFGLVEPHAIYVKPMDRCGVLKKQNVKINVMLVEDGMNKSMDGRTSIQSQRVVLQNSPDDRTGNYLKKSYTRGNKVGPSTLLFAGIQEANLSGFIYSSVKYENAVASILLRGVDGARNPGYVTLLTINIAATAAGGTYSTSLGFFKMMTHQHWHPVGPEGKELGLHDGFGEVPFVLVATRIGDDRTEVTAALTDVSDTNMSAVVHSSCGAATKGAHVNTFLIGEYLRDVRV